MFLSSATLNGNPAESGRARRSFDWSSTSVLLVSYDWNPLRGGPEALAGRRLATALLEAGAHVHVITADGGVPISSLRYDETVIVDRPSPANRVRLGIAMMRHRIPEPYFNWVREAVPAGERLLATLPTHTVIYGRAMPGCSNIVAWRLAQASGCPFVAHFSDEWPAVQMLSEGARWAAPYKRPLFWLWRSRILRDAGALTFTNPDQARAVLRGAGMQATRKSFVVTHLAGRNGRPVTVQRRDRFHIVHAGNLNPPGHTSEALLRGLRLFLDRTPAAAARVRFTQAGWAAGDIPTWIERCGLADVATAIGRVPAEAVLDLLDDANLLVGFDYARPDSATLLSKLPDYVAARRPILVLTAPDSAMGRLFREDGVGLTARYDAPDEVAACLTRAFDAWLERSDALLPGAVAIEAFSPGRVLEELSLALRTARRAAVADGSLAPMPGGRAARPAAS